MLSGKSSQFLAETLPHVWRHWEKRDRARWFEEKDREITITLARQAGTHAEDLAREVGRRLGWPVYDHELLERIAREMGLRTSLLERVDEKSMTWIQECVHGVLQVPAPNEGQFVRHLVETVLALGMLGECLIVGRGAGHILPPETTLRVRLVGPLEQRIAALARQLHISLAEAEQQLNAIDSERRAFVQRHFHKDPADPANYDLVLNDCRWPPDQAAPLILAALERFPAKRGPLPTGII